MFHSVELRTVCHATEDPDRVERAMRTLSPDGRLETETLEGHHGNPFRMMAVRLEDADAIRAFWRRVKDAGAMPPLLATLDERVDDDAVLHLRFDKQKAHGGTLELARHDDVIAVRAKVAAHPAKRSNAVRVARAYLSGV